LQVLVLLLDWGCRVLDAEKAVSAGSVPSLCIFRRQVSS
jgi:hypothetical protein